MTVSYDGFVSAFQEFGDADTYPEGSFDFWLGIAVIRLDECRWGDLLDYGTMLFVAHNMAVQARNAKAAAKGGDVGAIQGPTTAKSIDKLSKSQDASAVTIADAGDWNSTTYGIQFYQLMLMVGSGGMQF